MAIEELGYRPNRVARALVRRRSQLIGVVLPDSQNAFFSELSLSIERAAFDRGFLVLIGNTTLSPDRERHYIRAFIDSGVDGLLLACSLGAKELSGLLPDGSPRVMVHRHPKGLRAPSVILADVEGGHRATKHLIEHGHSEVACIAGTDRLDPVASRVTGWRRALKETAVRPGDHLIARGTYDRYGGYGATRSLITRKRDLSALFVTTDEQALGALRALADLGRKVPDDVAVMGFDGVREATFSAPSLSTVGHPIDAMAQRAVEKLAQMIEGGSVDGSREVLPVQLYARRSCGCDDPRR